METERWTTERYHPDNSYTMENYLEERLPEGAEVVAHDGSYAKIYFNGSLWSAFASGDGDFFSHKVEFWLISKNVVRTTAPSGAEIWVKAPDVKDVKS